MAVDRSTRPGVGMGVSLWDKQILLQRLSWLIQIIKNAENMFWAMNEDVTRDFGILRWAFDAELKDLAIQTIPGAQNCDF